VQLWGGASRGVSVSFASVMVEGYGQPCAPRPGSNPANSALSSMQ